MKRAWACLFLAAALTGHAANLPLSDGEELVYNVAWVVLPGAGRITVDAHSATGADGRRVLEVLTKTETRSLAHMLLPFEAWAKSVYDPQTGLLLRFEEQSKMRDRVSRRTMTFDYDRHVVTCLDPARAGAETYPFPADENPIDLINCVMEARRWRMRPGQTRDVFVFFERDFYPLTIHALDFEEVDTPGFTSTPALLLEPKMEKTPPKGMFKRGGSVRVWVGDWEDHTIPLRFQVQFKFGSGIATLSEYHPGAAKPDPENAPAPAGQN